MAKKRELRFKKLCETAALIERARESDNWTQVDALLELLRSQCALGDLTDDVDPHQLEALADYTPDAREAVQTYRRAIEYSRRLSEPTYSKRIWMAARLIDLGECTEARVQLIEGRAEAERLKAELATAYADELLEKLTV